MPRYSHKKRRNIKKSRKIRRKRGGMKTSKQIQMFWIRMCLMAGLLDLDPGHVGNE